ncbi:golgin subfamily B member 1 isoform X2 [Penaeus vannamei]|uniref:golgin subfamily B member 1 isoform X2 n=1 Tax=Penaeus vannamei TaxID=6689 RepID=UPI00387F7BD2
MLDAIHNMDEDVKVLEVVSDAEEMAVTLESEHEEGEISEDDDDDEVGLPGQQHFPHHYPSDYHKERQPGKNASATSAVVIYDDRGRTAIFTSPRKNLRDSGSYKRRADSGRRWEQQEMEKRRHKDDEARKHQKDNGKENKRSGTASRARSRSPSEQSFSSTKKKLAYKKSSEKWPSKKSPPWAPPVSQGKESTRASSPVEAASKISKSWGNGRKSPRPYMRHTLSTSSSRKTEVKASHHKTNKSKSKESIVKISDDDSEEKCDKSPRAKDDTSPKGNATEVPLITSQKQLPRGSFGEMLLKKTLKGKLKVCPPANKAVEKGEASGEAGDSKKEEVSEISEVLQQDCDTLDQEDEDELQLRLIALQSSLKVLSDVRREGCQSMNIGNMIVDLPLSLPQDSIEQPVEKEEEGKEAAPSDLPDQRNSENIGDFQNQLLDHHVLLQSDTESSAPLKSNQNFDTRLEESTPKDDEVDLILDDLSQSSTRSQPGSSITGLELELDAISTNRSYLDDEDNTRQLATNIEEQLQREIKDLADSNQDPVDMDICDSSPSEEDESFFDEDILKDIGEDISLDKVSSPDPSTAPNIGSQAKNYPVPVLDPGGQESFLHNSSNSTKSSSNNNNNSNFQIPVEWAYMMPPPPPPDQPPNDISNINNWCYDQNMYLQTMQSSYDSNEQYQQYNSYGTPTSDWGVQAQQPAQWNESRPENYENVSEQTEIIQENTETPASPEYTTSKTLTPEKEEPKPDSSPQEDLKDHPAEQYQAFMSVVLNQQKTQQKNSGTQRNLIEVQLIKYGNSSNSQSEAVKNAPSGAGTSGGAVLQVNKRSRARRRKRERQKEKMKHLKQLKAQEKSAKGKESIVQIDLQPGLDSVPSVSEDEDEDLLRAQLLIDLSRKKNQKQIEPVVEPPKSCLSDYQALTVDNIQAVHQDRFDSHSSGYMGHESTPPLSYPSSLESSPRLRPVSKTAVVKMHQLQARFRENSPTHKVKVNLRHGLSDIGGFGLDPKSSRYDYLIPKDNHSQKDTPKFKFPNIKPVIINLESDSDDENEDGGESCQDRATDEPQPSGSGEGDGVLSSSIDLLLKSMRNANKPEKEAKGSTQVKKGVALAKRTPARKAPQLYSTPNVVRHLSRTQQVEYRRLKEQLREKEMLQKKRQELLLRQKVFQKKVSSAARISPESPQSGDNGGEMSDGGPARDLPSVNIPQVKSQTPSRTEEEYCDQGDNGGNLQTQGETPPPSHSVLQDTREVIFKEAGGLQIQLANLSRDKDLGSNTISADEGCQGGSSTEKSSEVRRETGFSCEGSPVEDEDEEMLRLMVLKTLQKKVIDKAKSNDEENCESVDADSKSEKNDGSYASSNSETLKVVIRQKIDDVPTEEKETMEKAVEVAARSVLIENQTDLPENSKDVHQEDVNGGEWMVLDEVLDDIGEGNGENANSEELAVVKEEHGNKDKKLLIDEGDTLSALDCKETEGPASESVSRTNETECLVQEVKDDSEYNNFSHVTESENTKVENQTPADHAQGEYNRNLNEEIEETREKEIEQSHSSETKDSGKNEVEEGDGIGKEVLENGKGDERYKGKDTQLVPIKVSKTSSKSVDKPVDSIVPFTTQEHSSSETEEKRTEVVVADNSQDVDNGSLSACKEDQISPVGKSCVSGDHDSESTDRKENAEASAGTEMKTHNSMTSEDTSNFQTIEKQVKIHAEGKKNLEHLSEKVGKSELLEKDTLLVSESTKTLKGASVCSTSVNNSVKQISAIRTLNTLPTALQRQIGNAVGNASKSSSLSDVANVARKPIRTKRLLLLKRVEHEYTQKRIAMNEVISQLASLVHEATEEERQRQSLKSTITKLREKLGQMETQLEDKANKLKAKMARIRNLQTQITKDREEINQLEHKGEILGKKELGSDYKLPKVLGSPHSKSKDHMRKKQLAHNIDALRQQIGQVYNRQMYSKTQVRLEAKTKAVEKHISPLINLNKKEEGASVRRKILQSGQAPAGQNSSLGSGMALYNAAPVSATQNVNVSVAWNKKLLDSSLNMKSAGSIKGAPSMIKNKGQGKRKIMPDNVNAITKAAKTENVGASKGIEMTDIIDNKAQEAEENLPTKELDSKRDTAQPASQQSAMSDTANVSSEDKQRQKPIPPTKELTGSLDVTERIDEMNMLCPYDLLGRCNDDSCSYQHLRHPRHLTSRAAEIQGDPTGLSSHTSVSERQGALEECTARMTSSSETKPKDPLTNSGSAENIDGKVDPEQTVPQVDCKVDGLQDIASNDIQMPSSDKVDSNLDLCQTNTEDIIFVKSTEHCGENEIISEVFSEVFMSACDRSNKLNQEVDSIVDQIALTPCIDSEQMNKTSEKSITLGPLKEAVVESEIININNDEQRNLQPALPLQLNEGLPEVLGEFSKKSPAESNTDIISAPEIDIKDELPKDHLEKKMQESDEKEELGETVAQVPLATDEKASSRDQEDELNVDVKDASTIALKQKKKNLPKRCPPRKRTRNADLTGELDVLSQSPEPTARRTRRSINQKDVAEALIATSRNSSKKDLTKERSTPAKASPRRGGRKARGGKR